MPLAPNINHEPVPTRGPIFVQLGCSPIYSYLYFYFYLGDYFVFCKAIFATWAIVSQVSHCRQLERLIRLGPARFPALQSIM
ncbi:hypothetical protein V8C40DRAFT_247690 [Trichoderma camerunense]